MHRGIRRFVESAASRLGYAVIPEWALPHHEAAQFLRKTFALLETDCVLDVGANAGQYRDFLRTEVGFVGTIVSFEPIHAHAERLTSRARATDPAWQVKPFALGRTAGTARFNVMADTQFSSFLTPRHSQGNTFQQNRVTDSVEVEVRTLDDLLPGIEAEFSPRGIYLKLDTQGFDLEVLGGATRSLDRISGLQTEASVTPLYDGMPDFMETISAIRSMGFAISGMFPNNPQHFPRLVEFDCHFVSNKLL